MSYGTHRAYGNVEHRNSQFQAALTAGGKGFAIGSGAAAVIGYFAQPRIPTIQRLPFHIKASLIFSSGLALGVFDADRAGIAYNQQHFSDAYAVQGRRLRTVEEQRWDELSTFDKAITWTKNNKFSVVAGSWFASMGASWLYIQSQPLSLSQKIVQARVWAQGLTVACMLGMAAVSQIPCAGDVLREEAHEHENHSWRNVIHDAELRAAAQKPAAERGGAKAP
ncbi:Replication factor C, subunit RFC4 [Malassezia sp. CBS 17886]|nr:Replication factor C, subunit RFC4 [Malassezia sp. CBS 17886]